MQTEKLSSTKAEVAELKARVVNLENLVSHLAALSGQTNVPHDYGLKRWKPGAKDMSRWAG